MLKNDNNLNLLKALTSVTQRHSPFFIHLPIESKACTPILVIFSLAHDITTVIYSFHELMEN